MIGPDSNSLSGARSATNDDSAAYYYLLKKKNSSDFFNVKGVFLQKTPSTEIPFLSRTNK